MTTQTNAAARMGFKPGQTVVEIGWGEDSDEELRTGVEQLTGQEMADEDSASAVDAVILWFRDEDGELTDAFVDAIGGLKSDGAIWLLTPKVGHDGYIKSSDVAEVAQAVGLSSAVSLSAGQDWAATRLVPAARR
ncbi:DUF3052 domain-containing protein [Streptomyces sp. NPDC006430]|uniref:DUF3052 domain-containing protein n=1 Tax=Streptomyces sp. NPDC006430 TaxID=3154299 RepID=UPI0033AF5688